MLELAKILKTTGQEDPSLMEAMWLEDDPITNLEFCDCSKHVQDY